MSIFISIYGLILYLEYMLTFFNLYCLCAAVYSQSGDCIIPVATTKLLTLELKSS
jgi:hypothetical protein